MLKNIILCFSFIPNTWINNNIIFSIILAHKKKANYIKNLFYNNNNNNNKVTNLLSFPINFRDFNLDANMIIYINAFKNQGCNVKDYILYMHGFLHSLNYKHKSLYDSKIMIFLEYYLISDKNY